MLRRYARRPYPRPGSTPEDVQTYLNGSAATARASAAGSLFSSAALIAFARMTTPPETIIWYAASVGRVGPPEGAALGS
jgi:hypothetical protein